jgi:hypothetical protein
MYYGDLTINTSSVLSPEGFRIFVRGTLTIGAGSSIAANGGDGGAGDNGGPA